ncbi:MAG: hypothetical protein JWR12_443 [Mucilaginibacter sp.]|nr:hypothetical protein [Mucilaginibacter sp.]
MIKTSKKRLFSLLLTTLLFSLAIGHFLPPAGILAIPITLSLMIWMITLTDNGFNILMKSVLSYLFIGLNDIGLKLFAGGIHDSEGTGWIHLMLFIGLVPCFIMLLISAYQNVDSTTKIKALSLLIFISLIFLHLQVFETLGMEI